MTVVVLVVVDGTELLTVFLSPLIQRKNRFRLIHDLHHNERSKKWIANKINKQKQRGAKVTGWGGTKIG